MITRYQVRLYATRDAVSGISANYADSNLVDIIEFELENPPSCETIFNVLETWKENGEAQRIRERNSSVYQLGETLDEFEDAKSYNHGFGRIAALEIMITDQAQSARERILKYAIDALTSQGLGIGASFVRDVVKSSVLDRSDVKSIIPN